jgi:hypothetical protein
MQTHKKVQGFTNILMCKPANFCFNEETAKTNYFQSNLESQDADISKKAIEEFENYVKLLNEHNINVITYEDTKDPIKPDAVFCNNWCSMHEDGTLFLLPMKNENRRTEVRRDVMESLTTTHGFKIYKTVDYTNEHLRGNFLEGTGSMVIDHINNIIYACLSPRTTPEMIKKIAYDLGYKSIVFTSKDDKDREIYHTNVIMGLGEKWCVLCSETITNKEERETVVKTLQETGHEIIEITITQMYEYLGNCYEAVNRDGKSFLVCSERAKKSFSPEQTAKIEAYSQILGISLPTIETYGGGSARCMASDIRFSRD